METVGILMSVYHAGPFLEEQLASIKNQVGVSPVLIYHLDAQEHFEDAEQLDQFPQKRRVSLEPGRGVPRAYLDLICEATEDFQYWAFADQDDVWFPDKLQTAVAALSMVNDEPALWLSRVSLLREEYEPGYVGEVYPRWVPKPSLGNALVENIAPGCTMVWNRAFHDLLRSASDTSGVLMHDAWAYLVASALGRVLVNPEPSIAYRLHDSNTIGISNSLSKRMRRRMEQWMDGTEPMLSSQARALLNNFGGLLPPTKRQLLDDLVSNRRMKLTRHWFLGRLERQDRRDNMLLLPSLVSMRPSPKRKI